MVMSWLVHQTSEQFRDSFYSGDPYLQSLEPILEQTQSHLVDAETGRRGYLLTGAHGLLIPYDTAMSLIRNDIQQLKTLARQRPEPAGPNHRIAKSHRGTVVP